MSAPNDENSVPGIQHRDRTSSGTPLSPAGVLKLSSKANILPSSFSVGDKKGENDKTEIYPVTLENAGDEGDVNITLQSMSQENEDSSNLKDDDEDIITFKSMPTAVNAREESGCAGAQSSDSSPPHASVDHGQLVPERTDHMDDHEVLDGTTDTATGSDGSKAGGLEPDEGGESGGQQANKEAVSNQDMGMVEEDPFKPRSQLANTPDKTAGEDRSVPGSHLENMCEGILTEEEPFQPSSQNTPDPVQPTSQLADTPSTVAADLDPFKPTTQLVNTPDQLVMKEGPSEAKTELSNTPGKVSSDETSMQPEAQVENTPEKLLNDQDPFKPKAQLANTPDKQTVEEDPFKPKAQLANTPDKQTVEEDPFKPRSQLANTPDKIQGASEGDVDFGQLQPGSQSVDRAVSNTSATPQKLPDVPVESKHETSNSLTSGLSTSLENKDADVNPFVATTQLVNSPDKKSSDGEKDPFKPAFQLPNSPDKESKRPEAEESLTIQDQPVSMPDGNADKNVEDPFTPRSQLVNTPDLSGDKKDKDLSTQTTQLSDTANLTTEVTNVDPFKPQSQLKNSPETQACEGSGGTETQLSNTPRKESDKVTVEPGSTASPSSFSTRTESDASLQQDPLKPTTRSPGMSGGPAEESRQDTAGAVSEENPFEAKKQLPNTPIKSSETTMNGKDPSPQRPDTKTEGSEVEDPFKAKTQLANSPVVPADKLEEMCPFKPRAQLINSPIKPDDTAADGDPFKAKKQLANTPDKSVESLAGNEDELDPFKARKPLVTNTPDKSAAVPDGEPFIPQKQLKNSPAPSSNGDCAPNNDPLGTKTKVADSSEPSSGADFDPFKAKAQIANSPVLREQPVSASQTSQEDPCRDEPAETVSPKEHADNVNPTAHSDGDAESDPGGLYGLMGGGASATDNHVLLASGEDLGFGEDMFLPGAQVFNDPSALDLLEKFGSSGNMTETDLRKCSLYVKFDPLVKPTLPKTPDKMPAPTHAAPRRAPTRSQEPANTSVLNSSAVEESICLMGTPPRVSRRRSILTQRRMNTSVSQTITEEESVKPVDLFFSIDGGAEMEQFISDGVPQASGPTATLVEVAEELKYTESDWLKLQRTLALQYEGQMLAKEREFATQLEQKEAKNKQLQEQVEKIKGEKKSLSDSVVSMKSVVAEYEKTLNVLIAAKEKATEDGKKEVEAMRKERDQALEDGQAMESSFSEIHRRYEKLKTTVEGFKKNEEILKDTVKTWQEKVKAADENLVKVKAKAEEKIKEVLELLNSTKADKARVEAELKRNQVQLHSLESTLEQKNKEVKELTELCETLINQVGGSK